MALIKGTNTYATLEEANSYFANRIDAAAFDTASDSMKEKALITATSLIDTYDFVGQAISSSQSLAFPRVGYYYNSKLGLTLEFTNQIPVEITKATCEMAYHLLNNDGLLDSIGDVKKIEIGPIKLDFIEAPSKVNSTVLKMIKTFRKNGSNNWWRAN